MGGSQSSSSKSSSFFSCFSSNGYDDFECEPPRHISKVRPSDEDGINNLIGDPRVDMMTTDFIAKFHESHLSYPESHAV
ncbi:hypothetical protein IHE45_16G081500 [Dioscorea alata]|uniref:Uncharacterized protein n=1 Tax=Dioscorea alata TaxID=55571 RepID=A0ACB7UIK6_DIOAL|nr:hypothetical protein IHE45_16G081500 [Dioscorea alata]